MTRPPTTRRTNGIFGELADVAYLLNLVLPPGWLPLGRRRRRRPDATVALCFLGMAAVGSLSLWRAYRTTLRLYTGQFTLGEARPRPCGGPRRSTLSAPCGNRQGAGAPRQPARTAGPVAVGAGVGRRAGGFRSLLRAPEAKMMLLSPVILVLVFGSMFLSHAVQPPEAARPLMAFGATAMVLVSMIQFVGNQFGFDRTGFRVFVLCAAPRRDILLGKNLAVAPLALGMSTALLALLQVMYPMRLDHLARPCPRRS